MAFMTYGYAQDATVASGGNASSASGNVSYSVGQVVYTTIAGGGISVAQGVQQPYDLSIVTGVEAHDINLEMIVFPNPTHNMLNLTFSDFNEIRKASFKVTDAAGRLVMDKGIDKAQTEISLQDQASGVYFLSVIINNELKKQFKIIKN